MIKYLQQREGHARHAWIWLKTQSKQLDRFRPRAVFHVRDPRRAIYSRPKWLFFLAWQAVATVVSPTYCPFLGDLREVETVAKKKTGRSKHRAFDPEQTWRKNTLFTTNAKETYSRSDHTTCTLLSVRKSRRARESTSPRNERGKFNCPPEKAMSAFLLTPQTWCNTTIWRLPPMAWTRLRNDEE